MSYPPAPITAGMQLVAIGVINAVSEPAVISTIKPSGFAFRLRQAIRQIGTNIAMTA